MKSRETCGGLHLHGRKHAACGLSHGLAWWDLNPSCGEGTLPREALIAGPGRRPRRGRCSSRAHCISTRSNRKPSDRTRCHHECQSPIHGSRLEGSCGVITLAARNPLSRGTRLTGFPSLKSCRIAPVSRLQDAVRGIVLFRHERFGTEGSSCSLIEYTAAVAVQARPVHHFVAVQPEDESLIRTTAFVFQFAFAIVAFVRAGLSHLDDAPEFARFAIFLVKIVSVSEKSYAHQIGDNGSRLKSFEDIDPRITTGTNKVGPSQRNFAIRNIRNGSAMSARDFHLLTWSQCSAGPICWQTLCVPRAGMESFFSLLLSKPRHSHRRRSRAHARSPVLATE